MKRSAVWVMLAASVVGLFAWSGGVAYLFSANYLPHQFCYLAQPGLVWTNVAMDGLIALSYLSIFLTLFWMAAKLRRLAEISKYVWIFVAFGTFIIACGLTHVMDVVTVWWPVYRFSAAMKVVCAAASVPTAILIARAAPALTRNMEHFVTVLSTTQQEKQRALASLIAAEKLAVAGRISASIAHEIRNPLESVGNVLYLVRHSGSMSAEVMSLVETAEGEIKRAGLIARNTLSLYQEASEPAPVEIGSLVQSVIELQAADLASRKIRVETRVVAPVVLEGYPGELRQIVINLIQNAAAAISRNGRIMVRVQPRGGGYSITIADSGPGIAMENRAKLFTLFFTTKGEKGTGLGLWLVRSLVEKQGGHMRFLSRTEGEARLRGTVFNVWLPLRLKAPDEKLAALAKA